MRRRHNGTPEDTLRQRQEVTDRLPVARAHRDPAADVASKLDRHRGVELRGHVGMHEQRLPVRARLQHRVGADRVPAAERVAAAPRHADARGGPGDGVERQPRGDHRERERLLVAETHVVGEEGRVELGVEVVVQRGHERRPHPACMHVRMHDSVCGLCVHGVHADSAVLLAPPALPFRDTLHGCAPCMHVAACIEDVLSEQARGGREQRNGDTGAAHLSHVQHGTCVARPRP